MDLRLLGRGVAFGLLWALLVASPTVWLWAQAPVALGIEELVTSDMYQAKRSVDFVALSDPRYYAVEEPGVGIARYDYAKGERKGLLLGYDELPDSLRQFEGYRFGVGDRLVVLRYGTEMVYRHSSRSAHWVYDRKTKGLLRLSASGKEQYVTLSPTGRFAAFVRDNNIYVKGLVEGEELPITEDGQLNRVINGLADWVYEEEFGLKRALAWSPSGRYLAYLRFDESRVRQYSMPMYGDGLYPTLYTYKYPKAGEANSEVSLHVHDMETGKRVRVDVGSNRDQYIPRIVWSPDGRLYFLRLNRLQNHMQVLRADATTGVSEVVYEDRESQYVEEPSSWFLTFLPGGERFIVPSERDGYRHLYMVRASGGEAVALTSGVDEVKEVYGCDGKWVYYRAYDGSPLRTSVYKLRVEGGSRVKLSQEQGSNRAWFTPDFSHFVLTFSNARMPWVHSLRESRKGALVRVLERNEEVANRVAAARLPIKEFFSFRTPEGVDLNGYMVRPVDFDSTRRYPVMMYQYSGPNSQQVLDDWSIGWDQYLAQRGCVVVCVDGRGTGGRGEAFRKSTYGQLGRLEAEDQMHAARYLGGQAWVDADRIGIWGWSYGGYMSSLCLLRGDGLFRMAIAVAPVTNWRYYDSIYTERFMGLPESNASGYDDNSPMHFADRLRGHLLIVHGTADDNVHYQHAMQLASSLVRAGKPFDMLSYPDRNHGIRGDGARLHLYSAMARYIERNLMM